MSWKETANAYQGAAAKLRAAGFTSSPVIGHSYGDDAVIMAHDGANSIRVPIAKIDEFLELKPKWRPQRDPRFAVFAGWEEA